MKRRRFLILLFLCLNVLASARVWHLVYGPDHGGYYVNILFSGETVKPFRTKEVKNIPPEATLALLELEYFNRGCNTAEYMKFVKFNKGNGTMIYRLNASDDTREYILFTFSSDLSRVLINYEVPDSTVLPFGLLPLQDFQVYYLGGSIGVFAQPDIFPPKSEILPLVKYHIINKVGKDNYLGQPGLKFTIKTIPEK